MSDSEKKELIVWKNNFCNGREDHTIGDKIQGLFKGLSLQITMRLIILIFLLQLVYGGIIFITPFLLRKEGEGYEEMLFMYLGEFSS